MTEAVQTHPYDEARRWPDGSGQVYVVWSERLGENLDGWTSRELVEYEHGGDSFDIVADASGHPAAIRVQVGADSEWLDESELRERIEDSGESEVDWQPLQDALAAIADAEHHSCEGAAEGPLVHSFYVLESSHWSSSHDTLNEWATKLHDLPLCAVELDGDYGLAPTGGGMDLTWELAEAYLRLGYRLPDFITSLPAMAREGKDGSGELSAAHAAVVRALVRQRRVVAENAERDAATLIERYGIDATAG